CMQALDFPHTF
nr:immunoglobulin light chain junction region [Macaca mulatta]